MEEEFKKVSEDTDSEIYECPRCNQHYCFECNPFKTVEFNISDSTEDEEFRAYVKKETANPRNWFEESVCPFCYNQILEKFRNIGVVSK